MHAGPDVFERKPVSLKTLGETLTAWTVQPAAYTIHFGFWRDVTYLTSLTCLTLHDTSTVSYDDGSHDMKELLSLTRLHTLVLGKYKSLASHVQNLTKLQRLELVAGQDRECNLECLTQLTTLIVNDCGQRCIDTLLLPGSAEGHLQELQVCGMDRGNPHENLELYHLELALQLTSLHVDGASRVDKCRGMPTLHHWVSGATTSLCQQVSSCGPCLNTLTSRPLRSTSNPIGSQDSHHCSV